MPKSNISVDARESQGLVGTIYSISGNILVIKDTISCVPFQRENTRGQVTGLSKFSGARMRRYLRSCTSNYTWMVTLTYPSVFPCNGWESKEHLRRFNQELKRWFNRNTCGDVEPSIFWFLEFQERGAPHYHLFLNFQPDKDFVSKRWYEIVGTDDDRHLRAGTRCEKLHAGRGGTVSYASKYAAKLEQKSVPAGFENVGRFWGITGCRARLEAATRISDRDRTDFRVVMGEEKLLDFVQGLVSAGKAEVISRGNDYKIVLIMERRDQVSIRMRISHIKMYSVVPKMSLFDTCEVEEW